MNPLYIIKGPGEGEDIKYLKIYMLWRLVWCVSRNFQISGLLSLSLHVVLAPIKFTLPYFKGRKTGISTSRGRGWGEKERRKGEYWTRGYGKRGLGVVGEKTWLSGFRKLILPIQTCQTLTIQSQSLTTLKSRLIYTLLIAFFIAQT